ncbi:hypothetical protein K7432_006237 [Basidiobolus ranarum]|uniref:Transmembrane protein 198 n=1 Tax=Basidiobolus ranarum TaxID=34480 RepID=A0ABR2W2V2_9FUNG
MARRTQQRNARTPKVQPQTPQETKEEAPEVGKGRLATRSIMFIIMGSLFCFYGQNTFSTITFFSGFTVIGVLTRLTCLRIFGAPKNSIQNTNHNSMAIIIGLLGGQLLGFSERLSYGCIGALGGFLFGLYILCATRYTTLISEQHRFALVVSFVITGILTTSQLETTYVAFSTSFTGAFIIVYGVDGFLNTGVNRYLTRYLVGGLAESEEQSNHRIWYYSLLFSVMPLFWLGCLSQL